MANNGSPYGHIDRQDLEGLQSAEFATRQPVHSMRPDCDPRTAAANYHGTPVSQPPTEDYTGVLFSPVSKTAAFTSSELDMAHTRSPEMPVAGGAAADGKVPWGDRKVLGLRRTTFLLVLSNILLAVALVVLGVVQSQTLKNAACAVSSANLNGTDSTPGATAGATNGGSASSGDPQICFVSKTNLLQAECPLGESNANYTVPGTKLTFERKCGEDFAGDDMGRFPTASMADCLALCAQLNLYQASAMGLCKGVSWVYGLGPQGLGSSYCYPKSDVREKTKRTGVESAYLVQ